MFPPLIDIILVGVLRYTEKVKRTPMLLLASPTSFQSHNENFLIVVELEETKANAKLTIY